MTPSVEAFHETSCASLEPFPTKEGPSPCNCGLYEVLWWAFDQGRAAQRAGDPMQELWDADRKVHAVHTCVVCAEQWPPRGSAS